MQSVHGRSERKLIILSDLNQPIGPTDETVKELGSFLGTLARNSTFCPLNIHNWKKLNTKEDMWKYIKTKYDIHDDGKEWVFQSIQDAWRRYKCWLKKNYYEAYANDELRMAKKPTYVSEAEFKYLLEYWKSDKVYQISYRHSKLDFGQRECQTSKTNTENRKKLKNPHTAGKTGFATIREKKRKETSEDPSSKDMFVATRSRKTGRVYKESYEDTMHKIAEMEQIQTQEIEDDNQSVDAFATVMGPEHPGRVRLYERGVTKTILKQKSGNSGPSSKTTDEIMQQKLEEMEEKMQQRLQKKFEEQQETWRQHITLNVVAQLRHLNPDLRVDPNMLTFSGCSLGEASSTQQAAI